ncbi:MAG: ACP S-malonyltransferase [Lachnospiraceae bacterium]
MGKTAFIFPGQGAQYISMGQDFYLNNPICKAVYDTASEASGLDIPKLCFEENENINITEYTQIAMLATEVAMWAALDAKGIKADVTAGLSLGEYAALVVSHVCSAKDAFHIIRQRGIYMQEAVPTGGAMAAVIGLDALTIERICEETEGVVSIANYNCPGQIVITGEATATAAAGEALLKAGAKRCIPLKVSGPFHSPLLAEAGKRLGNVLQDVTMQEMQMPYIANVTADYVTKSEEVKPLLEKQVSSSVRWQQTIERMLTDGVTTFIEIGPGKTLSGFMRKINRDVQMLNIEKAEDVDRVIEAL